jgi:hypothetical protein
VEELPNPDELATAHLQLADDEQGYISIAQIEAKPTGTEEGLLYVGPDRMGTGSERLLFEWTKAKACALAASSMDIVAAPNARRIYEYMSS